MILFYYFFMVRVKSEFYGQSDITQGFWTSSFLCPRNRIDCTIFIRRTDGIFNDVRSPRRYDIVPYDTHHKIILTTTISPFRD